MQHHRLDFRNKSPLQQIVMGENLAVAVTVVPEEYRQVVRLEELRTVVAAAHASHERIALLRAELKSEVSSRKTLLAQVRTAARSTALGLTLITRSDPAAMQAAGLELAAQNTVRLHTPDAPVNLRAVPTANEGEAELRWKRTVRRCTFEVQWHADPPEADRWHKEQSCTKAKTLVGGMVSGGKYWFRVRATNAHGTSAWSNLAPVRVK